MTPEVKVGDKIKIDYFYDEQTGRHPDSKVLEILEPFNGKFHISARAPTGRICEAIWREEGWRLMCFRRSA